MSALELEEERIAIGDIDSAANAVNFRILHAREEGEVLVSEAQQIIASLAEQSKNPDSALMVGTITSSVLKTEFGAAAVAASGGEDTFQAEGGIASEPVDAAATAGDPAAYTVDPVPVDEPVVGASLAAVEPETGEIAVDNTATDPELELEVEVSGKLQCQLLAPLALQKLGDSLKRVLGDRLQHRCCNLVLPAHYRCLILQYGHL